MAANNQWQGAALHIEDLDKAQFLPEATTTERIHGARKDVLLTMGIDLARFAELERNECNTVLRPVARRLYLQFYPYAYISRLIGVSAATVGQWSQKDDWEACRKEAEKEFYETVLQQRMMQITRMGRTAIDLVQRSLDGYYHSQDTRPLGLKEAETISRIFSNLDKVFRLTTNQPTQIVENRDGGRKIPRTADELKEALRADPFIETTSTKPDPKEE